MSEVSDKPAAAATPSAAPARESPAIAPTEGSVSAKTPAASPPPPPDDPRNRLISVEPATAPSAPETGREVEAIQVTRGGAVLVLGWVDDFDRPLDSIAIAGPDWRVTLDAAALARKARPDVSKALGKGHLYGYGFMGFVFGGREVRNDGACKVTLRFRDGGAITLDRKLKPVEESELHDTLLGQISQTPHGGMTPHLLAALTGGLGDNIVRFNRGVSTRITRNPYVERFAGPPRSYRGSIVVCIYGRAEYHFIQNALFSACPGIEDYEFLFVSNSPELADTLLAEAKKTHRIYGLDQTIILLSGNAGFGAANNIAVQSARSGRVLIVNPDVFPRDKAWAARHTELVDTRPEHETRLFGAPLYYDDGSLMHGGMFFESNTRVTFERNRADPVRLIRVEHYGKGAPPDSSEFTRARPVPAVTGAFMSMARPWFEQLGGFTWDYVFGHYEDADLCLKSLQAGTAPWIQDLRLWHLEGKGSHRLPIHEGGNMVNRWLLTSRWGEMIKQGLLGPAPTHPLLRAPSA